MLNYYRILLLTAFLCTINLIISDEAVSKNLAIKYSSNIDVKSKQNANLLQRTQLEQSASGSLDASLADKSKTQKQVATDKSLSANKKLNDFNGFLGTLRQVSSNTRKAIFQGVDNYLKWKIDLTDKLIGALKGIGSQKSKTEILENVTDDKKSSTSKTNSEFGKTQSETSTVNVNSDINQVINEDNIVCIDLADTEVLKKLRDSLVSGSD